MRIAPDVIRKKGMVPKNGSVFFTIFQTFMTGTDAEEPISRVSATTRPTSSTSSSSMSATGEEPTTRAPGGASWTTSPRLFNSA